MNILEVLNRIGRKVNNTGVSAFKAMSPHSYNEGTFSEQQEYIKRVILNNRPFMMARFGSIELDAFVNWLQVNHKLIGNDSFSVIRYIQDNCYPNFFSTKTKNGLTNNAGFFPISDESIQKWGGIVESDLKEIDCIFTWLDTEKYIEPYIKGKDKILNSEMYFPYLFENPWTEALHGKKVLVVSPFAELIESQYKNSREKLFCDPRILPEFDLKTVKAYNVLRGHNSYSEISTWFDALEQMEAAIDNIDYEIALLGCGAYAFDLAAHVKRSGKIAITLCGSHEVLFGIYGKRYEEFLKENHLLNQYWKRPGNKYKPDGFEKVEGGAYW